MATKQNLCTSGTHKNARSVTSAQLGYLISSRAPFYGHFLCGNKKKCANDKLMTEKKNTNSDLINRRFLSFSSAGHRGNANRS